METYNTYDYNWQTIIYFGKHCNETLLKIKITDKPYLKRCYENELHLKYPELNWLFENLSEQERELIGI